jgi:hypothetical protein
MRRPRAPALREARQGSTCRACRPNAQPHERTARPGSAGARERHTAPQGPANVDAICALVEAGAGAAALAEHEALETPLHIAARCGRADALQRLLACRMPATARTKARARAAGARRGGARGGVGACLPRCRDARGTARLCHASAEAGRALAVGRPGPGMCAGSLLVCQSGARHARRLLLG